MPPTNSHDPPNPPTPPQSIPLRDLPRPPDSPNLGDAGHRHSRGRSLLSGGPRPTSGHNYGPRYEDWEIRPLVLLRGQRIDLQERRHRCWKLQYLTMRVKYRYRRLVALRISKLRLDLRALLCPASLYQKLKQWGHHMDPGGPYRMVETLMVSPLMVMLETTKIRSSHLSPRGYL